MPFGGTCALRGCEPKKVLYEAATTIDSIWRHENKGVSGSEKIRIKWDDLMHFKRTFTNPFPKQREDSYLKSGIDSYHGFARFIDSKSVEVTKKEDDSRILLTGKYILIATGAKPMPLNIQGEENIVTSDKFLKFEGESLPDRIVFIGGGYISFELGHIAARAGSKVTILHRGQHPLEHFDQDLVDLLLKRGQQVGINVLLQSAVQKIEKMGNGEFNVYFYDSSSSSNLSNTQSFAISKIEADMIVQGAGRQPNIESQSKRSWNRVIQ